MKPIPALPTARTVAGDHRYGRSGACWRRACGGSPSATPSSGSAKRQRWRVSDIPVWWPSPSAYAPRRCRATPTPATECSKELRRNDSRSAISQYQAAQRACQHLLPTPAGRCRRARSSSAICADVCHPVLGAACGERRAEASPGACAPAGCRTRPEPHRFPGAPSVQTVDVARARRRGGQRAISECGAPAARGLAAGVRWGGDMTAAFARGREAGQRAEALPAAAARGSRGRRRWVALGIVAVVAAGAVAAWRAGVFPRATSPGRGQGAPRRRAGR